MISVAEDVAFENLIEDFHRFPFDGAVLCRDEGVEEEEGRKESVGVRSEFSILPSHHLRSLVQGTKKIENSQR